jgi:broad specificity phosphatase PhoE
MTTSPLAEETSITHYLTLIRHPETVANVAHLLQGSTNSPLSVHGQNQQNALVKAIELGLEGDPKSKEQKQQQQQNMLGVEENPLLSGCCPTQIWSSPLPRALNLAEAIKKAFELRSSEEEIPLVVRDGLAEKSFGDKECTKGGKHVSGFPIGSKPSEGRGEWSRRVQIEGLAVVEAMTNNQSKESTHLVVITHGLWLSFFFTKFLKNMKHLPFADNTGIFTIATEKSHKDSSYGKFRIVCANNTSHLAGTKRQRGGIGSSASDKKQRTLGDMWPKKRKEDLQDT